MGSKLNGTDLSTFVITSAMVYLDEGGSVFGEKLMDQQMNSNASIKAHGSRSNVSAQRRGVGRCWRAVHS
jgi:hypothetical protein